MDLFIDINNHSNYLNRFLLPDYTYNDLYVRSLNMAFRLKEQNSKYILCFLPNCIEYIECIFASVIANVNTLHCSYSNILKFILLPDIDLILTTRKHLKIIDLLLKKCNSEIASDIMDKCIVVDGYTNGNYIQTKSIITPENKDKLYSSFLSSNTNYIIFPCEMDENNNFLKTSVQYIQYQSFQINESYSKDMYTLYPYDMYTLKGMVYLFRIINNRRCIVELKSEYRFNEDKLESVGNLHFILKGAVLKNKDNIETLNISKNNMKDTLKSKDNIDISKDNIESISNSNSKLKTQNTKELYVAGTLSNKDIFFYDSKDNSIKFEQTPDIYYSLLLDSEFISQKGLAFKDVQLLSFEKKDNMKDNINISKENMMKDNVYYINSALKRSNGLIHSKLNTMELELKGANINNHFKGFLDSEYNIVIEPLSHVVHLNDFSKLEDIFKNKCSLVPIVMDIPHDGIGLCNLLKYMTIQSERIFGIILLSNRRSFIYIYSKFSKANHNKIHSYILTELYKTNGITIKQPDITELFISKDNTDNTDNIESISNSNSNLSLKELLPLKINELFYVVLFSIVYYFEILKNKVLSLKTKVSYNLIEDLPLHNVKYDFSINTSFLNREWSEKLRQYCISQKLNINEFLKIICSCIIQKTDSNINVYNSIATPQAQTQAQTQTQTNTYIRHSSCPLLSDSPNLLPIYTRLYMSVREKIKVFLSEKMTIRKNAIYINSNVAMTQVLVKSSHNRAFYSGNMRNIISSIEFTDGDYSEINYNIFGIKVSNMYLIMSSVLWEMREFLQFILT
jgi:hypothetical protein